MPEMETSTVLESVRGENLESADQRFSGDARRRESSQMTVVLAFILGWATRFVKTEDVVNLWNRIKDSINPKV